MKNVIIYASTHHGNTKQIVEAIAKEFDIELIDATKVHEKDLREYNLIGFASGIFYSKFAAPVLNFARVNLPRGKEVFFIATAGNPRKNYFDSITGITSEKECRERGRYQCKGFDTYGPLKLVGGIQKGHPDEAELKEAIDFYRGLIEE